MANVVVTTTTPTITVDTTNSTVNVSQVTSNVVVSQVATVANANVITTLLSVTDAGGDGSLTYDNAGVFTYTGPSASEVRSHFSATAPITLSSGVIGVDSAALFTGKTTDNLPQGTSNIYFSTSGAAVNSDNLLEGATQQFFTASRFNASFGGKSTSDLSEGTNLYFTNARADARADIQIAAATDLVRTTGNQTIGGIKTHTSNILMSGNDGNFNMTSYVGANTSTLKMTLNAIDFRHENTGNVEFASPRTFSIGALGSNILDVNRAIAGNHFYNRDGTATTNTGSLVLDNGGTDSAGNGLTLTSNRNVSIFIDANDDSGPSIDNQFSIYEGNTDTAFPARELFRVQEQERPAGDSTGVVTMFGNANVSGHIETGIHEDRRGISTIGGNLEFKLGSGMSQPSPTTAGNAYIRYDPFTSNGRFHIASGSGDGSIMTQVT